MYRNHDDNDATKRMFDNIINPINIAPKVKGRFKLRAMKGNIIMRESAWCPNLIVNGWFNQLFAGPPSTYGICGFLAGAGTATPAETDTALVNYLGGGNDYQEGYITTNATVSPRSMTVGVRYRGTEGAVVGNVSEIAMYWNTSGIAPASNRSIINRARVVDEFGNPTSITVLLDEFLEVIWEFTYFAIEGATGTLTVNIAGTPTHFDYEIQPVSMNNNLAWYKTLGTFTGGGVRMETSGIPIGRSGSVYCCNLANVNSFGDPASASAPTGITTFANNFTSYVMGAYTVNSKTRLTTIRLPLNNGNHASPGARTIYLSLSGPSQAPWCTHQMLLDGPVLKTALQLFDLPINVSMRNA